MAKQKTKKWEVFVEREVKLVNREVLVVRVPAEASSSDIKKYIEGHTASEPWVTAAGIDASDLDAEEVVMRYVVKGVSVAFAKSIADITLVWHRNGNLVQGD
jgi:hypothetical protein